MEFLGQLNQRNALFFQVEQVDIAEVGVFRYPFVGRSDDDGFHLPVFQ